MQKHDSVHCILLFMYRLLSNLLKINVTPLHKYIYIVYKELPSDWSLLVKKYCMYHNGFGYVWDAEGAGINHSD